METDDSKGNASIGDDPDEDLYREHAWRWRRPGGDMRTWHSSIWDPPYRNVQVDTDRYMRNAKLDMLISRIDGMLSK